MKLQQCLFALAMLASFSRPVHGEEPAEEAKQRIEFPSPDGQFAFRYTAESEGTAESEAKGKTYELIRQPSGEVLACVAQANVDPGPSERFNMQVQWRSDSKAFVLTATLWKRGSGISVYLRHGDTFREVKLPKLLAEIPEKVMRGKQFPHIVELNSKEVKRWQKDGSLVVGIENIQDGGDGGSITANRTVVLGFTRSGKARVLKSSIKFTTEKP